ncbi:hypothetical protein [Clostridium argentinense]|nr:hypothetical protein [Clostridium argentinense]
MMNMMMDLILNIWEYRLTDKGKDTEQFRFKEKREVEIIKECFNS